MTETRRQILRELMRRVDEVRGLSDEIERTSVVEPDDTGALIRTVGELVEELERSHRRLIETNVQLVSLREVASSMATTLDAAHTSRTVSRYLSRAFGFEEAFLLLLDRERGVLEGAWTHAAGEREHAVAVELPVRGARGAVTHSLWLNRALLLRDPERHPPLLLPDGHPLLDTLGGLGSFACVPLQRSHALVPVKDTHELCGARCILGDATLLAPPPQPDPSAWAIDRDERQGQCLGCELMPLLGVIGIARASGRDPLGPGDLNQLESIALSVAPVIENARLYQDLRRSERSRLHILDSMASALVAVNMKGEIMTFNRAAEQLLGATEAEVRGQPFGARFGAEGEALLLETLEQGREVLREETLLRARDGAPLPVSLTTSLLRDDRRAIYGAIATFVDLTPLKRAEERARSQDRLAALGRFTSSVAHEIRNPLTGIGAGVQYLARALEGEGPQREHLAFIQSEIKRLDRIVQDLFDITHPRGLQLRTAPLEDAARRALQSLEAVLAERGVQAALEVVPMTPPAPYDADQIQQVFINLVKNAAEASPAGATVRIVIGPVPMRGRGRREAPAVTARVEDRGSGIAAEALKTIFEPFVTTKPGGTGLGLYICHDIVKRHGGALTVQSEPGRGASFVMELPLEVNGGGT